MNRFASLLFSLLAATILPALAHADKAGCADYALFPTRMQEYTLENCKVEEHGIYQFSESNLGQSDPVDFCV